VLAERWKLPDRSRYEQLIARYSEPHRRYHTLQHLEDASAVDLSILGAETPRFDQYEQQVRDEYGWVPGPIYRHKRKAILESFLARSLARL
jgi:predicted metal-dependent HD superfamily phosphohydrolase